MEVLLTPGDLLGTFISPFVNRWAQGQEHKAGLEGEDGLVLYSPCALWLYRLCDCGLSEASLPTNTSYKLV